MRNEDYTVTYYCKYCKKNTKQLVKEISESRFKELTKSEFIAWCGVCGYGGFMTKDEYKLAKLTMTVTTKAGGILWKAIQLNG